MEEEKRDEAAEANQLNAALLKVEQFLLGQHATLIKPAVLDDMLGHCRQPEEAMAYLLCAALGLHLENPANRQFLQERLLPSLHCLPVEDFSQLPYVALLGGTGGQRGEAELTVESYDACQLFPCGDLRVEEDGALRAPLGFFRSAFHYPALKQGGREWMTLTPNEILTMEEPLQGLHGHVLVYGLGLGYYAYQALCQPAVQQVTVVDSAGDILQLFRDLLLPLWHKPLHEVTPFADSGRLTLVQDDAFRHAAATRFACADGCQADVVFTDLWHDAGDGLPLYQKMRALAQPFHSAIDFRYWIEPTLKYYLGEA